MKKTFFVILTLFYTSAYTFCQIGWSPCTSGTSSDLNSVFFVNSSVGWIVSYSGQVLKSTNGGDNWYSQLSGTSRPLNSVFFIDISTGYAVGGWSPYETVVLKTTNGGINWVRLNFPPPPIEGFSVFFTNANTGYISGNINLIYKTTDGGNSWVYTLTGGNANLCRSLYFINQNLGWVIGRDMVYLNAYILKTTDSGFNWDITFAGSGTKEIHAIHFWNVNEGIAVGDSGMIIKTTDGGSTWTNLYSGTVNNFNSVRLISPSFGWAVGGNYSGRVILMTSNSGQNWTNQINNQGAVLNSVFFISELVGWAVGSSGTVLKTTNGGVPVGTDPISLENPKSYYLFQNYPNPFNPSTKIKFEIPKSSFTKLIVYDVLGREIAVLLNEQLERGSYEIEWNASYYTSGVYFYTLTTESFNQTKRMVLVK